MDSNPIPQSTRDAVLNKLTDNLKAMYPVAQQADEQLELLKKENKGRFSAIFPKDAVFQAHSDRFLPYMVEVAEELTELGKVEDNRAYTQALNTLLFKIRHMNEVLTQFHAIKDAPQGGSAQKPVDEPAH